MLLIRKRGDRCAGREASQRRGLRTAGIWLAIGLAVGSVSALTTWSSDRGVDPQRRPVSLDALHRLPPVNAVVYSWDPAGARITRAQQRLTVACMARHGLSYRPAAPATKSDVGQEWPTPFGRESLAPYGGRARDGSESSTGRSAAYGRALLGDPGKQITAHGERLSVSAPAEGCLAEAEQRMLGDQRVRWMQLQILLQEAQQDALGMVMRDRLFRAANARWSACMHRAGFELASPSEVAAHSQPGKDAGSSRLPPADVRCKERDDYLSVAYTRLAVFQRRWLTQHPDVLRDRAALVRKQDAIARTLLGVGTARSDSTRGPTGTADRRG
ncbi:hypothetical protein [Streptomyces sp. NPDC086766]|uniref:hypothetical protein n=1 Tax=Streptomyces sp. NPDC086766 TaxID=3365754 RepID=UPI0038182303